MGERYFDSPEGIDKALAAMEIESARFCEQISVFPDGQEHIEQHKSKQAKIASWYLKRKDELLATGRSENTCNLTHDLKDSLRGEGIAIVRSEGFSEDYLVEVFKLPRSMVQCYLKGDLASFTLEQLVVCLGQLGVTGISLECK